MQSLFSSQLEVLLEAVKHHLRLISNVDDLLAIEVKHCLLDWIRRPFGRMRMWWAVSLCFSMWRVCMICEMSWLSNLLPLFSPLLWCRRREKLVNSEIGDAIENDRLERYIIHSAEDYFGAIARYQLLDEAPTVGELDGLHDRSTRTFVSLLDWYPLSYSASPTPSCVWTECATVWVWPRRILICST